MSIVNKRNRRRLGKNRGFTLLEVLIAAVILSVGLLGAAGLQLLGLRYSQSAYLRSQATLASYDIVDRMRSNIDAVIAGKFDSVDSDSPPASTNCLGTGSTCTDSQFAAYDIAEWSRHFKDVDNTGDFSPLLPGGHGKIVLADAATRLYTVTISWEETDAAESDGTATQSISTNFYL